MCNDATNLARDSGRSIERVTSSTNNSARSPRAAPCDCCAELERLAAETSSRAGQLDTLRIKKLENEVSVIRNKIRLV